MTPYNIAMIEKEVTKTGVPDKKVEKCVSPRRIQVDVSSRLITLAAPKEIFSFSLIIQKSSLILINRERKYMLFLAKNMGSSHF